jgi:hypothetical protein
LIQQDADRGSRQNQPQIPDRHGFLAHVTNQMFGAIQPGADLLVAVDVPLKVKGRRV